jgi:hypothetical protein
MATERQIAFIEKLRDERDLSAFSEDFRARLSDSVHLYKYDNKDISNLITDLLNSPMKTVAGATPITEPGMYAKEKAGIFRVRISKTSGKPYAMRMILDPDADKARFEYEAGAIRYLTAENRMSLEDAKKFGLETGFCCVCGAFLTDPKSVAVGIGPVCAKKV